MTRLMAAQLGYLAHHEMMRLPTGSDPADVVQAHRCSADWYAIADVPAAYDPERMPLTDDDLPEGGRHDEDTESTRTAPHARASAPPPAGWSDAPPPCG